LLPENELLNIEYFFFPKLSATTAGYPNDRVSFSSNSKKSPPCAQKIEIGFPLVTLAAYINY